MNNNCCKELKFYKPLRDVENYKKLLKGALLYIFDIPFKIGNKVINNMINRDILLFCERDEKLNSIQTLCKEYRSPYLYSSDENIAVLAFQMFLFSDNDYYYEMCLESNELESINDVRDYVRRKYKTPKKYINHVSTIIDDYYINIETFEKISLSEITEEESGEESKVTN